VPGSTLRATSAIAIPHLQNVLTANHNPYWPPPCGVDIFEVATVQILVGDKLHRIGTTRLCKYVRVHPDLLCLDLAQRRQRASLLSSLRKTQNVPTRRAIVRLAPRRRVDPY
jgi:hypothetical protein